jgi:putative flippase GtrA
LSAGGTASRAAHWLTGVYQQFRQQIHEGAKFGLVGIAGVVVVIVGADVLHFELGLDKYSSLTIATIVATVVTFLGNRYWSFSDRQGSGTRSETIMFFVLNGVGLGIQYACLALVTDALGLSGKLWYTVANLIGIGFGTLFRFWSYRKWIWVPPEVHLARLRRGRHRRGRTTPIPDPPVPGARTHPAPSARTPGIPAPSALTPGAPAPSAPSLDARTPGIPAPSALAPGTPAPSAPSLGARTP